MFSYLHKLKPFLNALLKTTGLYLGFHKLVIVLFSKREKLSKKYIKGKGLEIGALHTPLKIYNNARVIYVDRLNTKGLRKHYPELNNFPFVPVGLVDNGEILRKVKKDSQDFVIANHFIEHCENPIETLKNQLRVLKKGGIIYWAVPDKQYTFDTVRKNTTLSHFDEDYKKGPIHSRKMHYLEWATVILQLKGNEAELKAQELLKSSYSIHFHVWTRTSFEKMLDMIKDKYKLPFAIVEVIANINEFIVILRKI